MQQGLCSAKKEDWPEAAEHSRSRTRNQRRIDFFAEHRRFMPGHCHYDHELGLRLAEPHKAHDYGKRALFLLRGRDRSGRNDFSVGH